MLLLELVTPEVTPDAAPATDFYADRRMFMQKKLLACCGEAVLKSHGLIENFHGAIFF